MMPRNPPGVGEPRHRSAVVGLISCDDVTVPVTRHRHRVDREDLGGDQRSDRRATVGLDADLHRRRGRHRIQLGLVLRHKSSDQRVQRRDTARPFGHPPTREPPSVLADVLYVMMIFSSVVTNEQHPVPLPRQAHRHRQRGEDSSDLNGQVLTPNVVRHPSSSSIPSRPAGARSAHRPQRTR